MTVSYDETFCQSCLNTFRNFYSNKYYAILPNVVPTWQKDIRATRNWLIDRSGHARQNESTPAHQQILRFIFLLSCYYSFLPPNQFDFKLRPMIDRSYMRSTIPPAASFATLVPSVLLAMCRNVTQLRRHRHQEHCGWDRETKSLAAWVFPMKKMNLFNEHETIWIYLCKSRVTDLSKFVE